MHFPVPAKNLFAALSVCVFLFSCGGKKTSPIAPEVAQDFTRYLTETQRMPDGPGKHLYVLLHPGYCGSCTEQIQRFVKTELENCPYAKTLVFSSDQQDVTAKFSAIPGLRIVKDDAGHLQKYGLANGLEIYMVLQNGKTVAFGPINTETIGPNLHLCAD